MRPDFEPLTLAQFRDVVTRYPFTRRITSVHVHHTWRPTKADYRGISTIQSMWRHHTEVNGWRDIAQHVTIAPDGIIWTGRNWDLPPASSSGQNGTSLAGPFMFETIGDFDVGREKLEDVQREAVIGVIAAIQLRHNLSADLFQFHRELGSPKTCPGSGIKREKILEEVQALHAAERTGARARSRAARITATPRAGPFATSTVEAVGHAVAVLGERAALGPDGADAEDRHDDELYAASIAVSRDLVEPAPGARAADEIDPATLHTLRPHVVNLTGGLFSNSGVFQTAPEDVDRIFNEHLNTALDEAKNDDRPLRILFWAHGGLIGEKNGLTGAARHIRWWKQNGIYPIYFVWETGLLATIGQIIRGASSRMPRVATRDLWDHTSDPLIEMSARALGGVKVWGGMKFSAQRAAEVDGGALYVAQQLAAFCKKHKASKLELHAAGHSAGSIFHSHFIPAAIEAGVPSFQSLAFLAPAVRIDTFSERLEKLIGPKVKKFAMFTMAKDWEKRDNVIRIYHKSLLYLISLALEPNGKTPILGLEEMVRADPSCKKLFGLDGSPKKADVIWSKTTVTTGADASTSTAHVDFDEDPRTMNSVVERILEVKPAFEYPQATGRSLEVEELPEELAWAMNLTAPADSEPVDVAESASLAPPTIASSTSDGRKFALCIGIDEYREEAAKLNGCVNDAKSWASTLKRLGFGVTQLHNGDATRTGIEEQLKSLITPRNAGDIVVIQYSGHGTRLPDLDGDEDDAEDEAMCPVDFDSGQFLIDDDLREIFAQIPAGVSVTCFFDCCHSGTITRVVQPRRFQRQGVRGGAPKKRFIRATPEMIERHRKVRKSLGRGPIAETRDDLVEVVFTACRSDQVAYESDGQGDFTRIALELLTAGLPAESNDVFYQRVIRAFGDDARQQPQLNASAAGKARRLLARLS